MGVDGVGINEMEVDEVRICRFEVVVAARLSLSLDVVLYLLLAIILTA